MDIVNKIILEIFNWIKQTIDKSIIPSSEWPADRVVSELKEQLNEIVKLYKEKQLAYIVKQKTSEIRREIESELITRFNDLDQDFWTILNNTYNESVRKAEDFFKIVVKNVLELDSNTVNSEIENLNDHAFKDLEFEVKTRLQEANFYLLKKFKHIFGKNEKGIPVNWKAIEPKEIENKYVDAKRICLEIRENLKYFGIRKRGTDTLEKVPVLPSATWEINTTKLTEDFELEFKEAERKHSHSDLAAIPKWFWIILIFFMYDDVLRWISNPFLFYPVAIFGTVVMFLVAIGMGSEVKAVSHMVFSVGRSVIGPRLQKYGINI